jgi:hypothetical protein
MSTYAFIDVVGSLSGPTGVANLGYGASIADEGITFDAAGDRNTMTIGADGNGMHTLHSDRSGTVTARYLKTSPTNAILQAHYDAQSLSSTLWGKNMIVVRQVQSGDITTASSCAFKKKPTIKYGKVGEMMEWTWDSFAIDTVLGVY